MAISENLPKCRTIEELENNLLKLGIETQYKYKGHTNEKQGVSFKKDNVCFKGSQVDRKFSFAGLEKTFELKSKQETIKHQKPNIKESFLVPKPIALKDLPGNILERGNEHSKDHELSKSLEKTIDILLKPEHTNAQMPFSLLPKTERRKKKKSKGISR